MNAENRAEVYQFLSSLFSREPTRELVDSILTGELTAAIVSVEGGDPQRVVTECFQELIEVVQELKATSSDTGELLEYLRDQYYRLLSVPGPDYVAPYESVYVDKWQIESKGIPDTPFTSGTREVGGLLWGQSTIAVLQSYLEAGIQPDSAESQDAPDHIGLELEFMAYLCAQESSVGDEGGDAEVWVERQQRFLSEHLTRWLPDFTSRLLGKAPRSFYACAASALVQLSGWLTDSLRRSPVRQ